MFDGKLRAPVDKAVYDALLPKVDKRHVTYGFSSQADWQAHDLRFSGMRAEFEVVFRKEISSADRASGRLVARLRPYRRHRPGSLLRDALPRSRLRRCAPALPRRQVWCSYRLSRERPRGGGSRLLLPA